MQVYGQGTVACLGCDPEVSLSDARDRRLEARKSVAAGIDPSQAKQAAKREAILRGENTFEAITREWHKTRENKWTSNYAANLLRRFEADIFPRLGNRPVAEITPPGVLSAVRVLEKRGALDLARRTMQTCGQIFMYAIATGRAVHNPVADLRGALKTPVRKH
ncbi:MAG: integrase arm-type DNA-binding domain-containing protein [Alphaproteobacteria bacterium]|nr:integrase arm-type DNA-binding domain-containing protein [Alphaproteobacteria bacterium]